MLGVLRMTERRYSREEVDAILGRAVERERTADELSREQLVAIAQEIGVSPTSIDRAITEITSERGDRDELLQMRRNDWRGFVAHLIPYLGVNALLVLVNVLTTRFPWALFPILGWGIGLLSHLFAVAMPNREELERRLQHRRERGLERERRRAAKRQVDASAKELEVAFTQGAAALLQAAAKRINQSAGVNQPQERVRVDEREPDAESREEPFEPSTRNRRQP
jgi:hypothetical protein